MTSGGARSRSGPAPDPNSGASDRRGLTFTQLPTDGYDGPVPDYPAPIVGSAFKWWEWAWSTPQAALWATPQWSWVVPAVADWCRIKALLEAPDAPASLWAALRQREGDILLSNDALLRAGYRVAVNELSEKRSESAEPKRTSARDRLRAVGDA